MMLKEKMITAAIAAKGGAVAEMILKNTKNETICADIQAAWSEVRKDEHKALQNAVAAMKAHKAESIVKVAQKEAQVKAFPMWAAATACKMLVIIIQRRKASEQFWAALQLFLVRPQCFESLPDKAWLHVGMTNAITNSLIADIKTESVNAIWSDFQDWRRWSESVGDFVFDLQRFGSSIDNHKLVYEFFQNANEEKPLQNVTEEVARALFSDDLDIEIVVDMLAQQDKTVRTLAAVYEAVKRGGSAKQLEEQLDKTLDKLTWHYRKAISIADNIKFVSKIADANKILSSKEVNSSYCAVFNNLVQSLREIRAIKKAAWLLCRYQKLEQYSRIEKTVLDIFEKIKVTDISSEDPWYALYIKYRTYQVLNDDKAAIIKEEAINTFKEQRSAGLQSYCDFVNGLSYDVAKQQGLVEILISDIGILMGHVAFAGFERKEEIIAKLKEIKQTSAHEKKVQKGRRLFANRKQKAVAAPSQQTLRSQEECIEKIQETFQTREGRHIVFNTISFFREQTFKPEGYTVQFKTMVGLMHDYSSVFTTIVQKENRYCKADNVTETFEKDFTHDILLLSFRKWDDIVQVFDLEVDEDDKVKAEMVTIFKIWAKDGNDSFWTVKNCNGTNFMYNIGSGEFYTMKQWKKLADTNGYYVYSPVYCSASTGELKNFKIRLCGNYVGPDTARGLNWEEVYAQMTSGATKAFAKFGKRDFASIGEFMQRMCLPNAFSHHFAKTFAKYVLFTGKFKDKNGFECMDGTGYISALFAAATFTEECGGKFVFPVKHVIGILLQERAYNVNKRTGLIVAQEVINTVIENLGVDKIVFYVDEMTDEQKDAYERFAILKFKKEGDSAIVDSEGVKHDSMMNKLIVFCQSRDCKDAPVDYLTDANGQKTAHTPSRYTSGLKTLSIAHKDNHTMVTSTQLLSSTAEYDLPGTIKMCNVLGTMEIQKSREKIFAESSPLSVDDFVSKTITEIDPETGEEKVSTQEPNYSLLLHKIAPVIALRIFRYEYKQVISMAIKKLNKMFGKLNLPIDGTHCVLLPDIAAMIAGIPILGSKGLVTEMYSSDKKAGTISQEEYIERFLAVAAEKDLNENMVNSVVRTIKSLSKGILVIPANDFVMRLNEGCDFDGDSMFVAYMERRYTKYVDENGREMFMWDENGREVVKFKISLRYPKNNDRGCNHTGDGAFAGVPYQVEIVPVA